jgi:hypothetical protein
VRLGQKFHQVLDSFLFAVGLATVILGVNEGTVDVLDRMGSNYWLAWCATISGTSTVLLILGRHSAWKTGTRKRGSSEDITTKSQIR